MAFDPVQAREWDRWRGGIDQWQRGVDGRFRDAGKQIEALDKRQDEMDRELTRVTTKIGAAAAIGAVAGGAIVTFVLTIATRALGG
jgi:hypothetical protein